MKVIYGWETDLDYQEKEDRKTLHERRREARVYNLKIAGIPVLFRMEEGTNKLTEVNVEDPKEKDLSQKESVPKKDKKVLYKLINAPDKESGTGAPQKDISSIAFPPVSIDAETGQNLRSKLIQKVGSSLIDYYPAWATSYATGQRRDKDGKEIDAKGCGPGMWLNSELIHFACDNGFGVGMSGMLYATGYWKDYMLRLDKESCEVSHEKCVKVIVVLQSQALLKSNTCLDELFQALENNIEFIVIRCDDDLPPSEEWWPLPITAMGKKRNRFLLKRKKVVEFLVSQNTIPPPGETIVSLPSAPAVFLRVLREAISP